MNVKPIILVVDDDEALLKTLVKLLQSAQYRTLQASNGIDALRVVEESKPDLVLLDVMLPIINGWEVCKMIKSEFNIPVILITARDVLDDKLTGFSAGADDYIVKPFEPKEVIALCP